MYDSETPSAGLESIDLGLATEHILSITGLIKGVRYNYIIKSCDESENCEESEQLSFTAGADYLPPVINASIPAYYNSLDLDFDVITEPHTYMTVYLNDGYSRSGRSDEQGLISFKNIRINGVLEFNIIRIEAIDESGNEAIETYEIMLDTIDPEFTITTNISNLTRQSSLSLQGYVSEQSTISVFINHVSKYKQIL